MAMRRFVSLAPAFVVLAASCALLFAVPALVRRIGWARTTQSIALARHELEAEDNILERLDQATRALARAVEPSVVHIQVMGREGRRGWRQSTGAGWVYDDAGHIVTNAHVVAGAGTLNIQFHDGYTARGEVLASDAFTDIAIVQVPPGEYLHPIARAGSDRIELGQRVFAFGSPLGFKFSMSQGIVSGIGRDAPGSVGQAGISNYIQTDAAINFGNSGGPLVDSKGRLVGMNVAIAAPVATEESDEKAVPTGIAFAIPVGTIERRVPQLIGTGKAIPAYLGVRFAFRQKFVDVPGFRGEGMPLDAVVPDGPAAKAGLQGGDVIVSVSGEGTASLEAARAAIATAAPGKPVVIRLVREKELLERTVVLDQLPAEIRAGQLATVIRDRAGVIFIDTRMGAVVGSVRAGSEADRAGLGEGQRVLRVGDEAIDSVESLMAALAGAGLVDGKAVTLTVRPPGENAEPVEVRLRLGR